MKLFVTIVALTVVVIGSQAATVKVPEDLKVKILALHKECQEKTGVDQAILDKVFKHEYTDDPKLKEQLLCASIKDGFLTEGGDFKMDALKARVNIVLKDADATNKLVEKCAIKKETPQITAYESMKCLDDNSPVTVVF